MLPEFTKQFFQLPLISTTWTYIQSRYFEEKKNSLLPIRLILSMIEQTLSLVHDSIFQPLCNVVCAHVTRLDHYLCSHIDTLRYLFPIIDLTSDEVIKRYGDLFLFSCMSKTPKSSTVNSNINDVTNSDEKNKFKMIPRYAQFLTNILMTFEMYSKCIKDELNDHINTSRTLWKKLNMEDGRSLDEVDLFSEKLLVLGRRITGNYRQLAYLTRYQWKRCRSLLFSFLRIASRFRSTLWRVTRRIKLFKVNSNLNSRTRHGLVISKERIQKFLETIMVYANQHPWTRWTKRRRNPLTQLRVENPSKLNRPMFFLSSNNTSDCSESEEKVLEQPIRIFKSTPCRKNQKYIKIIQSTRESEDVLSDISSSLSSTPEQSFDIKEIIRQVGPQSSQSSRNSSLTDYDYENQVIQQALNETDGDPEQGFQSVAMLDLSATLASGCPI